MPPLTKAEFSSYLMTKPRLFGTDFAVSVKGVKGEYNFFCLCYTKTWGELPVYGCVCLTCFFGFLFPQIAGLQMLLNAPFVGIL